MVLEMVIEPLAQGTANLGWIPWWAEHKILMRFQGESRCHGEHSDTGSIWQQSRASGPHLGMKTPAMLGLFRGIRLMTNFLKRREAQIM
jgi:hypothetical protein